MSAQMQAPAGGMPEGEVCIANISPAQRLLRLRFAVILAVVGLAVLAVMIAAGAGRWWRLAMFPLLGGAAVCYFEWHDKTCVALSAVNARYTGDRPERIKDLSELAQVRRQSVRIYLKSILWGLALTALALAIPGAW